MDKKSIPKINLTDKKLSPLPFLDPQFKWKIKSPKFLSPRSKLDNTNQNKLIEIFLKRKQIIKKMRQNSIHLKNYENLLSQEIKQIKENNENKVGSPYTESIGSEVIVEKKSESAISKVSKLTLLTFGDTNTVVQNRTSIEAPEDSPRFNITEEISKFSEKMDTSMNRSNFIENEEKEKPSETLFNNKYKKIFESFTGFENEPTEMTSVL